MAVQSPSVRVGMIARAQHIHSVSSLLLWSVCIKSTIKAVAKLRTLNYYARCWIALSGLCVEDSPAALEWIDIFSASRNSNFIIITSRHATPPTPNNVGQLNRLDISESK